MNRKLVSILALCALTALVAAEGGDIIFSAITSVIALIPTNLSTASQVPNGSNLYVCSNGTVSASACNYAEFNDTITGWIQFQWTVGNGTNCNAVLYYDNGTMVGNLTAGANYTASGTLGQKLRLIITRIVPNSQSGSCVWTSQHN